MACIVAERACVDVDALFSSCWEQNASLARYVCSLASLPSVVDFQRSRSNDQFVSETPAADLEAAAVIVEASAISVNALDVKAAVVNAAAVNAAAVNAAAVNAAAVNAAAVHAPAVHAPAVNAVAVNAAGVNTPAVNTPAVRAPAVEVMAVAIGIADPAESIETADCSAGDAPWLGVESEVGAPSFPVEKAERGVKVGAEESNGCCRMSRSESSCSSHSACLIELPWDSCSSHSSALRDLDSFADSYGSSGTNFMGVHMGIGRGFCSSGKGWSIEAKGAGQPVGKGEFPNQLFGDGDEEGEGYSDVIFDGKGSVSKGIGRGFCSSGKAWNKGAKDAWELFGNQLFGNEEEEDESYSSRGLGLGGKESMCYMNQLYMDEEEEEERSCPAATGISVGIGRFGARRRITGYSSRVTLRRMSASLRQF